MLCFETTKDSEGGREVTGQDDSDRSNVKLHGHKMSV